MTPQIDLGSVRVTGAFFLRRAHQAKSFDAPLLSQTEDARFCFTYRDSLASIEKELLEMIRRAKRKIFITSFRIGDRGLFEALYEAAARLRGGVYVITALDDRSLGEGLKELDEIAEPGEMPTLETLKANFADMTRRGIYVRGHSSCHAKFVVVDDEVALVSSANLETAALRGSAKRGPTGECGLVIRTPREVNQLARFFTRLWHEGCDWEVPAGISYRVSKRTAVPCPCIVRPPNSSTDLSVIWTDGREHFILQTLQDLIGRAGRELLLASFSLCEMSAHADLLLDPLAEAIQQRGVRVRMLVRGRNNVATHRDDAERLARLGVEIAVDSLNHAKGVIADGRFGALFSANFDAQHGLTNGVETGVRLDGLAALDDARAYFEHAMEHADLRFVLDPDARTLDPEPRLDRGLATGWRKPWTLSRRMAVSVTEQDWEALAKLANSHLAIFEQRSATDLDLWCGTKKWHLYKPEDAEVFSLAAMETTSIASPELLGTWMSQLGRRRKPSASQPARGVCPAIFTRVQSSGVPPNPSINPEA